MHLACFVVLSANRDDKTGAPPACEHRAAFEHELDGSEVATCASHARALEQVIEREVFPHLAPDRSNVLGLQAREAPTAAFVGARGSVARSPELALLAYVALPVAHVAAGALP